MHEELFIQALHGRGLPSYSIGMPTHFLVSAGILAALLLPMPSRAQSPGSPSRIIRRDIPMTATIQRAHAAGTRDSTGRPGARYWQLRTDYTIQARIDPATQRITGRETVLIHNTSTDSLPTIRLRLDPNIFRGTNPVASPWRQSELTDGMVVTRMAVDGRPVNLNPARNLRFQSAPHTEDWAFDLQTTTAFIRLSRPVPAGGRLALEVDWHFKLPGGPDGNGHRMTMRWADSLFQPTQWYPRVAVYDDLRGWDEELYLGPAEFYNNFGRFDVRIEAPAGWVVSGTGVLQNAGQVLTPEARARLARALETDSNTTIVGPGERIPGGTWHFVADTVNDFAWATARDFVWQTTRATIPGKGPVPIHMVFLPGRANLFANAGSVTRHALEFYSRLWFPYTFPQLTLQDGPSQGMEYPMVINSNQGAADHESAHQWWPMTVSNNETWYGWMDEGFNQYMNILSGADRRNAAPRIDGLGASYGALAGTDAEPPMMWNSNYAGPEFWGFVTYSKMPLLLSSLGGIASDSAVQRAHREWAEAWKFKHPSPWDWMFFMQRALGRDLGWFFNAWLFETQAVQGSIANVAASGSRTTVTVRQDGDMPSPIILDVFYAGDSTARRETVPVDVWFDGRRTHDVVLNTGRRRIERVVLDPGCRFPDRDSSDNVWPRGGAAPCRTN